MSVVFLLSRCYETEDCRDNADYVRWFLACSRSFLAKAILYGTAFHLWSSFVLVRFDDDDIHDDQKAPETRPENTSIQRASRRADELTEDELGEEDGLFIPLTWSWLQEGELYTASDPEWQEFVTISKDRQKLQKLRGMYETGIFGRPEFIDGSR